MGFTHFLSIHLFFFIDFWELFIDFEYKNHPLLIFRKAII